ncbi:MAG: type II toxin-antitoxin system RelE/ParE family toxin [Treponema sp.]|jgi:hypothetical protein|nr:type II toxin-antitoxin system RelE/ParE family toxin [Treponema sp.]
MVKNYMLFYTINEEEKIVTVIRFLYGHRDWKNILKINNAEENKNRRSGTGRLGNKLDDMKEVCL